MHSKRRVLYNAVGQIIYVNLYVYVSGETGIFDVG